MTCIVGVRRNGIAYLGADSASVADTMITTRSGKLFVLKDMIIGYTTSFRKGDLLRFTLEVPERTQDQEMLGYLVRKFVPALRDCLREGGALQSKENEESGLDFLIGRATGLYYIGNDFQVEEIETYAAVGSGAPFALGALAIMDKVNIPGETLVSAALRAAAKHSTVVRQPFYFADTQSLTILKRGTE